MEWAVWVVAAWVAVWVVEVDAVVKTVNLCYKQHHDRRCGFNCLRPTCNDIYVAHYH